MLVARGIPEWNVAEWDDGLPICLRARYAMSGTDLRARYAMSGGIGLLVDLNITLPPSNSTQYDYCSCLRTHWALSGTDLAHAASPKALSTEEKKAAAKMEKAALYDVASRLLSYGCAIRCPVLTPDMLLPGNCQRSTRGSDGDQAVRTGSSLSRTVLRLCYEMSSRAIGHTTQLLCLGRWSPTTVAKSQPQVGAAIHACSDSVYGGASVYGGSARVMPFMEAVLAFVS
eukprot:2798101-Rhodomonas_salina.1